MKKAIIKIGEEIYKQTQGPDADVDQWVASEPLPEGAVIEYIDLDQDYDFQLAQAIAKRKAEYPSPEDFLNAYFDGGMPGLDVLREQRLVVKAKYPKPSVSME